MPADGGPDVVLFDLDGVLSTHDTFAAFVRRAAIRGPWRIPLLVLVPALMRLSGESSPWRGRLARYGARIALLGRAIEETQQELADFGDRLAVTPGWPCDPAIRRLREHLAAGDRVVVVTATEWYLARAFLDGVGLQGVEVLGSSLRRARAGLRLSPHNYGPVKASRLAAVTPPPWDLVYTDSAADLPLMQLARNVCMVNADPRTVRAAQRALASTIWTDKEWS